MDDLLGGLFDNIDWTDVGLTAGGSIVSEMATGMTLDEVKALGLPEIIDEMGDDIVKSRVRCATLALGTLQAAVDQLRRDRERREAGLPPIERQPFQV